MTNASPRTWLVLSTAAVLLAGGLVLLFAGHDRGKVIVVGSKSDVEGRILGEMMALMLEDHGHTVHRQLGLGGTLICYEALKNNGIQVYPEYSGTIEKEILRLPDRVSYTELQKIVRDRVGLELLPSFGFENTYAIAVSREAADKHRLKTIGNLARPLNLRYGFSHEFLNRQDGWPGLARAYQLTAEPVGLEHGLAYQAIANGKLDVTDVYSTDGDIKKYGLVLLKDDRHFFPEYLAGPLANEHLDSEAQAALGELAGRLSADEMQRLNGEAVIGKRPIPQIAFDYLKQQGLLRSGRVVQVEGMWSRLGQRTLTHLKLTTVSLLAAMVVAIPVGILIYHFRRLSRPVLYLAGILQTIPSIALLALMIPIFNIGAKPAIVALFLYALLPILRNTTTGLLNIDPVLRKVAVGMGMTAWQRLWHVELPLAGPTILAGIKTAAVVNIGTATLAAFIGAGGLGEPIVTGLDTNDTRLILEGAIPAALLAVVTELGFELLEKLTIPGHLLQKAD